MCDLTLVIGPMTSAEVEQILSVDMSWQGEASAVSGEEGVLAPSREGQAPADSEHSGGSGELGFCNIPTQMSPYCVSGFHSFLTRALTLAEQTCLGWS